MPKRCVLGGCGNTNLDSVSLYKWPKDEQFKKIWTQFVIKTRKWSGPSEYSVLCSAHFDEECYTVESTSSVAKKFGFKPVLKTTAIPTILPESRNKKLGCLADDELGFPWRQPLMSSTPRKALHRPAYLKRERARVVDELLLSHKLAKENDTSLSEVTQHPPDELVTHSLEANPPDQLEVTPNLEETIHVSTTELQGPNCSIDASKNIATEATRRHIWSRGVQASPQCTSTGTQCNLIKAPALRKLRPLPDEGMDASDDDGCSVATSESASDEEQITDDSDYEPEDEHDESFSVETPSFDEPHKQRIFMVYESSLLELFNYCPRCHSECPAALHRRLGSKVFIHQKCLACSFVRIWSSQPDIGGVPAGNLMLSAAILFSGASASKTLCILKHLGLVGIAYQTFMAHQATYLQPAVSSIWAMEQAKRISLIKDNGSTFKAAGDGRADSPGHSAKYGCYTILNTDVNKVVHIELVSVTEVKNSNAMEKEGLVRAMSFINDQDLQITDMTTDRHSSIKKYLREEHPGIKHSFDVWHVTKGVGKKIDAIAKKKSCDRVKRWKKSVTNHMYWCATSTANADPDLMEAKWISMANHVQNVHQHDSPLFPNCLHEPLEGDERKKKWMVPNHEDTVKLTDMMLSKLLIKDIRMLSSYQQTSSLEAYHGVVNHFAPKMICFSYQGMKNRLRLAALHFNENAGRSQAKTKEGQQRYRVTFPKFKKGGYTVKRVLVDCTYEYVNQLKEEVYRRAEAREKEKPEHVDPPSMSALFPKPDKQTAVDEHRSRFGIAITGPATNTI